MKNKTELELFNICNKKSIYTTVGDEVDYAFLEDGSALYIYFEPS